MHPIGKIIGGLILILVGLALFALEPFGVSWLTNFIILVTGTIPILLILIGLFIVWLEADELKVEKELEREVEEEKKEKPKTAAKRRTRKRGRKKKTAKEAEKAEENKEEEKPVDEA